MQQIMYIRGEKEIKVEGVEGGKNKMATSLLIPQINITQ